MSTTYIAPADANKILRKQLKTAFSEVYPGLKFSVTKDGFSTRIRWTDGPARARVEEMTTWATGTVFDSMADCADAVRPTTAAQKSADKVVADGLADLVGSGDAMIGFLSDYVFTERTVSDNALAAAVKKIEAAGFTVPRAEGGRPSNRSDSTADDAAAILHVGTYPHATGFLGLARRLAEIDGDAPAADSEQAAAAAE